MASKKAKLKTSVTRSQGALFVEKNVKQRVAVYLPPYAVNYLHSEAEKRNVSVGQYAAMILVKSVEEHIA